MKKTSKNETLTDEELTALFKKQEEYIEEFIKEQGDKFKTPSDTEKLVDSIKVLGEYKMPTELALIELYTEVARSFYRRPKYTTRALCEMVDLIYKDLNMLNQRN